MLKASTLEEQGFDAAAVSIDAGRVFRRPRRGLRVSRRPARRMRTVFERNVEQRSESLVRRVNEMIRKRSPFGYVLFFCECGDACFRTVWLDVFDYDAVISVPNAALLASSHGPAEIDESTAEASSSCLPPIGP
jgi:hypothetical protein